MRERPLLRLETAMLGNTRILLILDSQIFYKSITINNLADDAGEPSEPNTPDWHLVNARLSDR